MYKQPRMLTSLTTGQVIPDCEAAQGGVGEVEVGIHLELGHLVGQVQEGLGVHRGPLFLLPISQSVGSPVGTKLSLY